MEEIRYLLHLVPYRTLLVHVNNCMTDIPPCHSSKPLRRVYINCLSSARKQTDQGIITQGENEGELAVVPSISAALLIYLSTQVGLRDCSLQISDAFVDEMLTCRLTAWDYLDY
jgi:hypothetical protein